MVGTSAASGGLVPAIRFEGFSGEWEENKFRDVISNLTGGASIAPGDYQDEGKRTIPKGAVNFTGIADLSGCKYITLDFFQRNILSKVSSGDLITSLRDLVPTAPNMGRVVKIVAHEEDFLMPQGVYKIFLVNGIDEQFIIAYSNSDKYRRIISREKNGSTQVHIRNGEFLDIEITQPKSNEQTKIGQYFQQLDTLIAQHQQKHDKLLNLKKSLLEKMFPKQGADEPAIRFKGFSGAWEEKSVGEVCSISTGKNNTQDKISEGKYPFYVRSATIERSNNYLFDEEAVLTVGDGVGTGKVYHYVKGKYDLHQRVYRMYDFNGVAGQYFYYFFSNNFYYRVISMTAKTSVDSVRLDMISGMPMKLPVEEQPFQGG